MLKGARTVSFTKTVWKDEHRVGSLFGLTTADEGRTYVLEAPTEADRYKVQSSSSTANRPCSLLTLWCFAEGDTLPPSLLSQWVECLSDVGVVDEGLTEEKVTRAASKAKLFFRGGRKNSDMDSSVGGDDPGECICLMIQFQFISMKECSYSAQLIFEIWRVLF